MPADHPWHEDGIKIVTKVGGGGGGPLLACLLYGFRTMRGAVLTCQEFFSERLSFSIPPTGHPSVFQIKAPKNSHWRSRYEAGILLMRPRYRDYVGGKIGDSFEARGIWLRAGK